MSEKLTEIMAESRFYTTEWQLNMLRTADTWFVVN